MSLRTIRPITTMACLIGLAGGCVPPARHGGFGSSDPAARLYAAHRAGAARDRSSIRPLIEQLESDDPALRLVAINALERITGTRLGYNPYAPLAERSEAVGRWIQAAHDGRFDTPNAK